ncbi:MAG: helix-turn-helix domain-containing protein [Xanthobacteraceae bacterium]
MSGSASGSHTRGTELAASSVLPVSIWDTSAAREHERFSYWRDAVCKEVFNISIEAPPERFSARFSARASGPLRFAMSRSTGYVLIRNRRDISTAPADHYTINIQTSGNALVSQGGNAFAFQPNDIMISDGREPFRAVLSDGGHRVLAVIPREMITRRAPWIAQQPLHRLAARSPFVDLARRHLLELTGSESTLTDSATILLTDSFCNLLALASSPGIAPTRMPSELQIEAMLAFCRQNLHNAELSPQLVADRLGISVRTLHLRFQQIDQTFRQWVRDNRLAACRLALRDPNQCRVNISDIAYRWGFNDLSHFNKVFRARFDQTPGEWRNGGSG